MGDPITKKYPNLNNKINRQGMIKIINYLKEIL